MKNRELKNSNFKLTHTVQMQKQKAITLIALVITIIVLLILAGVTISALVGNDGLIAQVEKSRREEMKAEAKENINMAIIQIQTRETPKGNEVNLQTLNDNLNVVDNRIKPKNYKVEDIELKGIYTADEKTKFTFIIDEKLNVKIEEAEEGEFSIIVTEIEKTSLRVTADISELNKQIAHYTYIVQTSESNQIKFEKITDTTCTVTGLKPGTEYDVYVLAYDNTGNIIKSDVETVTTELPEIVITDPYIGTDISEIDSNKSVADNSQTRSTILYINFEATLEETNCKITLKEDASKTLPYEITANGIYTFIASGIYNGKTTTKEIEVIVNKYKAAAGLVKYDAGTWTQEEINQLEVNKLYDYNFNRDISSTFKLKSDSGLNFTFGGFKKGDSRNISVSPQSNQGIPDYDGWQILESNVTNGKTYVTKLIHAGSPENFVFTDGFTNYGYMVEYLLSSGQRQTNYNKLSDNTTVIKPRSWEIYKDKSQLDLINNVHIMTVDEAKALPSNEKRKIGASYYLASEFKGSDLYYVDKNGSIDYIWNRCTGIRPVITMNPNVYIVSGDGTVAKPYVLDIEK